jgi:hypothetical protein
MKRLVALVSVVLAFTAGSALAGSGPAGNWKITVETPNGSMQETLMIKEASGAYSGSMQGAQGPASDLKNVMVKGDEVMFHRDIETPNGNFALDYDAKVDGDNISGTAKSGGDQPFEIPFKGTRE